MNDTWYVCIASVRRTAPGLVRGNRVKRENGQQPRATLGNRVTDNTINTTG